ncbi:MAG TPA: chemotaxis protein CheC [Candidatus Acetatifactor stercoripullorum]|uniref:Chemotaxis protein CheC n=1 Tax=Candidatus Acetatifactor stercoripullorum TaxID=2838414 RepID=A0A9D1R6F9_9FIRM|nr:chemotaxis protein CheC [Candidatus Acetatifactor stercoripullorum]HIW82581.1 chemotaxis protein CheC [Candidatus Acetatifactor stercoripullorum]
MGELSLEKVSETYFDVLKEIGNIGAGNAMTALSQMLQCKVDMKVPQVKLLEFSEVGALMGGEEQVMVGVLLGVEGDITGSMMFLVEKESAKHLINKVMMGMAPEGDDFSEMELSAMKELGNIITGAYLNSLSTLTNLQIYPTPPALTVDMAGAILSVPAIQFGVLGDRILLIQSQFYDEIEIDGYFILIPDLESYSKILSALGIPVE